MGREHCLFATRGNSLSLYGRSSRLASITLVAALAVVPDGCVSLPDGSVDKASAIGYVSASAPMFTPLESELDGDKALKFGALRDEAALARWIQKPNVEIRQLRFEALRGALQAKYSGIQVDGSSTRTEQLSSSSQSATDAARSVTNTFDESASQDVRKEEKRTLKSPTALQAHDDSRFIDTPERVQAKFQELLTKDFSGGSLSPAEVATLVAAYKTYMVHMEEYYNAAGYRFEDEAALDYLPYKVHFTVTAEPGWYTRYHAYDAVVDVEFGSGCKDDGKILVLSVMPLETSQTIGQLVASLEKLQLALDAEGAYASVAAKLELEYVREVLDRVEGLRLNKTLVVGYPASNRARVRFRPSTVPTKERRDFQPASRPMTALVLVKKPGRKDPGKDSDTMPRLAVNLLEQRRDITEWRRDLEVARGHFNSVAEAEFAARANFQKIFDAKAANEGNSEDSKDELAEDQDQITWAELGFPKLTVSSSPAKLPRLGSKEFAELMTQLQGAKDVDSSMLAAQKKPGSYYQVLSEAAKSDDSIKPRLDACRKFLAEAKSAIADVKVKAKVPVCYTQPLKSVSVSVSIRSRFEPALHDNAGEFAPSLNWLCFRTRPVETHVAESAEYKVSIPPWLAGLRKPFLAQRAFGYYWGKFGETIAAEQARDRAVVRLENITAANNSAASTLELLERQLAAANQVLESETDELLVAQERLDAVAIARDADPKDATLLKSELEAQGARAKLVIRVRDAAGERARLELAVVQARKQQILASTLAEAHEEVVKAEETLGTALQKAVSGRAVVGFEVTAPAMYLSDNATPRAASVWGRLVGAGEAANVGDRPFVRLGAGDLIASLHAENLDLSLSIPKLMPADYAEGVDNTLRVFIELLVVDASVEIIETVAGGPSGPQEMALVAKTVSGKKFPIVKRTALEVVLESRARTPRYNTVTAREAARD